MDTLICRYHDIHEYNDFHPNDDDLHVLQQAALRQFWVCLNSSVLGVKSLYKRNAIIRVDIEDYGRDFEFDPTGLDLLHASEYITSRMWHCRPIKVAPLVPEILTPPRCP